MEQMRSDFEAWMKQHKADLEKYIRTGRAGMYKNPVTHKQWMAWQASRAAVEIDIPDGVTTREALDAGYAGDYAAGMDDGIDNCEKAILAAGLKIKGK